MWQKKLDIFYSENEEEKLKKLFPLTEDSDNPNAKLDVPDLETATQRNIELIKVCG